MRLNKPKSGVTSKLPAGVSKSPKGAIGEHRAMVAREQKTFKGAKSIDARKYFG